MRTKTVTPLDNQDFRRVSRACISFNLKRLITSYEYYSDMHSTQEIALFDTVIRDQSSLK